MQNLSKRFSAIMLGTALSAALVSGCSNAEDKEVETTEGPDMTVEKTDAENTASQTSMDEASTDMAATANTATDTAATSTDSTDPELSEVMVDTGNSSAANNQKSIVTNATSAGTPADTVKKALNATYHGNVDAAAAYYQVDIADFKQELADTQMAFQQTVDSITLTNTTYNDAKTEATVDGELMLKGQTKPVPATYTLKKVDSEWKIFENGKG